MSDDRPMGAAVRQRLADALRLARLGTRKPQAEFADDIGWSQSKVAKIETGRTRPSIEDVGLWAQAVGLAPEERAALLELAHQATSPESSWADSHAEGLTRRQQEIAEVEASMTRLDNFQPAMVPGLLQTPEYARHILTVMNVSGQRDVAAAVAARLNRQAVLFDESKVFTFVLTEAALRWRAGPRALLRAQADRLLALMDQPNLTIKVLPLGGEPSVPALSGFSIFHVPGSPFVLVEIFHGEMQLGGDSELALYARLFERLEASALADAAAADLIRTAVR